MYFTTWKVLMDPGLVRVRETPGPRRGWKYTPGGTTYRVGSGSRVAVSPTHIHLKIRYQNDNIRSSVSILGCWWASSGETHLNRPHFDLWKLRFSVSVREELRAYVGLDYWLSTWCSPSIYEYNCPDLVNNRNLSRSLVNRHIGSHDLLTIWFKNRPI